MARKRKTAEEMKVYNRDRLRAWRKKNPEKMRRQGRAQYWDHVEKRRKLSNDYCKNNRPKRNITDFKRTLRKFGITVDHYNRLMIEQNSRCAICQRTQGIKRFNIDHNHQTGKARGLLCAGCNRGLGMFRDNIEFIWKAFWYLEKHA